MIDDGLTIISVTVNLVFSILSHQNIVKITVEAMNLSILMNMSSFVDSRIIKLCIHALMVPLGALISNLESLKKLIWPLI